MLPMVFHNICYVTPISPRIDTASMYEFDLEVAIVQEITRMQAPRLEKVSRFDVCTILRYHLDRMTEQKCRGT